LFHVLAIVPPPRLESLMVDRLFCPAVAALVVVALVAMPQVCAASDAVSVSELLACQSLETAACPAMAKARKNPSPTATKLSAWLATPEASAADLRKVALALGYLGSGEQGAAVLAAAKSKTRDKDLHVDLLVAAARLGAKEAGAPLLDVFKADTDTRRRILAAGSLGLLGHKASIDALIAALKDKNTRLAATAAQALGMLEDPRAIDPLIDLAGQPSMYTPARMHALGALTRLKAKRAVPLAVVLVDASPRKVGRAALDLLAAVPTKWARPAVAFGLRTPDLRESAARAAVTIPDPGLAADVGNLINAPDVSRKERDALIRAAGSLKPKSVANSLVTRLEQADHAESELILKTLPKVGDRTVIPRLVRYLPHAEPTVAKFVVYALENLSGKRLGLDVTAWQKYAGLPTESPTTAPTTP